MLFELRIYKDIIAQYPTWNELRAYLESEEGGLFRIVDMDILCDLCIIRYEKGMSNMELPHSAWFRSVLWHLRRSNKWRNDMSRIIRWSYD